MLAPDIDMHPYFRDPDKARAILDIAIADNVAKGIGIIRVVHGKGKGNFREMIHRHLGKNPDVEGFMLCDPAHGGSGATWVHLRVKGKSDSQSQDGDDTLEQNGGDALERGKPLSAGYIRIFAYAAIYLVLFFIHAGLSIFGITTVLIAIFEAGLDRKNPDRG
jgi:hypothetical protein